MPPISDLYWNADDDALAGGPSTVLIAPASSGARSLVTLAANVPAPAAANFTITAGIFGPQTGFEFGNWGSVSPVGASISGNLLGDFNDVTLVALQSHNFGCLPVVNGPASLFEISVVGVVAQNLFTSLTVNGSTYLALAASFCTDGSLSYWQWIGASGMVNGGSYPVNIT